MKRQRNKVFVSNPLANATGKQLGERTTLTLDTSKLKIIQNALIKQKAIEKDKFLTPDFKVEECTYAILPYYLTLGYAPQADYAEFGKHVIKKWYDKNKKFKWYMAIPAIGFGYMILIRPVQFITNAVRNKPYSLFDINEESVFIYGSTQEARKAWKKFSGVYYNNGNNVLLHNLFERVNLYFKVDFKKRIKDLHAQQEDAKLKKKEAEFIKDPTEQAAALAEANKKWKEALEEQDKYMKYLSDNLLDEQITGVLRENSETLSLMKDCVRTFIENPAEVMGYQWKYYRDRLQQESGIAKQMKSGYGASGADGIINNMVNSLRNLDQDIYTKALKHYIPRNNYNQILYKNMTEASKWLEKMQALPVQVDISQYYTNELSASDVNTPGSVAGGGRKSSGRKGKSNLSTILVGGGILAAIAYFKYAN